MCEKYFAVIPLTVEPGVNTPIPLNVDHPREVGADRIVKAVAALALYTPPLIIIDFGTGDDLRLHQCARRVRRRRHRARHRDGGRRPPEPGRPAVPRRAGAAQGRDRPQHGAQRPVGHRVRLGRAWSTGSSSRMKAELDGTPRVIATGGYAALIVNVTRSIQEVQEHLAFEGLRLLWERAHPAMRAACG